METFMEMDDFIVNCNLSFQRSLLLGTFRFLDEDESEHETREFKINDATAATTKFAYLIDKNKSFARPSRAFFLIPYISFKFSANLRREMTISQVFQRT